MGGTVLTEPNARRVSHRAEEGGSLWCGRILNLSKLLFKIRSCVVLVSM